MANRGTWKITIGGADFADYSDVLQPEGNAGGPKIVPVLGYGASAPVYLNLGNYEIPRSFTLTRDHPTNTAATAWYETATQLWGGVASVVVLTHLDYAGVETTFTIQAPRVDIEVATPIGPCTITKIKITGGAAT